MELGTVEEEEVADRGRWRGSLSGVERILEYK